MYPRCSDGRYIDILSIQTIFYGIDTVSYRSSDIESNDIVTTPILLILSNFLINIFNLTAS